MLGQRKQKEYIQAIQLREQGKSVKEIARKLNVSSSTVSLWVRHIPLSPGQKARLKDKVFKALQRGRIKAEKVRRASRLKYKRALIKEAISQIGKLSKRDLFVIGIALYWAEGFRKDSRLGFASSDPAMIKLFLNWLGLFGVPKQEIRLRIGLNISHKTRLKKVQQYWEKQTRIPSSQFQKAFFQKFKWKKEYPDPNSYFGVLRVRANNQGGLFIKILTWIEVLRKKGLPA